MIVELFRGPGGWAEGLRLLDLADVGLELDHHACRTAVAAGHATLRADVAAYPTEPFRGRITGKISSPPCQAWSRAGKRGGIHDQALVHQAVTDLAHGRDTRARLLTACRDPRSILAAEPMRWLRDLRPEWTAMEEVPDVLPLWQQYAQVLRAWGYSAWAGVLNAADYGVPQTRRRAILIASRVRQVGPPEPTHAEHPMPGDLFGGPGRARWVSMAQALDWPTGLTVNTRGHRRTAGGNLFSADEPAQTLVKSTRSWWVLRNGNQPNAAIRTLDQPAPTIAFGHNAARVEWVLHTNRDQRPDGTRQTTDPVAAPAPTFTSKSGSQWAITRPDGTERRPITLEEATVIQSFRADYPWHGTKTKQFEQIGNAVPPLLAAHVVAAATGLGDRLAHHLAHALEPAS